MKEFYDQFDVLINCSLRDSGCFVVMEAMARGLAVISLDTGGPKVNTTDETSIKIHPIIFSDLVDEFMKAIVELGTDGERREQLGKAAREYARRKFLIQNRTKMMNEYYKEAVANAKGVKK